MPFCWLRRVFYHFSFDLRTGNGRKRMSNVYVFVISFSCVIKNKV